MTWIDNGSWDNQRGKELRALLAKAYSDEDDMVRLLDDAGISRELLTTGKSLGLRWHSQVFSLQAAGRLRDLLRVIVDEKPALRGKIAALDVDDLSQCQGNPPDPYHARLVGYGQHPMIDRIDLRAKLRKFLDDPMPVLMVRGPADSGKSHSFELIQHVVKARADKELFRINFAHDSGTSASELMNMIRLRLALPGVARRSSNTTRTRSAAELVSEFVGVYRVKVKPKATRILLIDGLNRADLEPDVDVLVRMLVEEVVHGQLECVQLVLTGYAGVLHSDIMRAVLPEDVRTITETDVRLYFEGLAADLGATLTAERVAGLVREATDGEPGLAALADRVRTLALDLIGSL